MRKYIISSEYRIVTPIGHVGGILILSRPAQCDGCGENMHAGQHCTRHHKKDTKRSTYEEKHDLFCQTCYPFRYAKRYSDTYQIANRFPVEVDMKEYWI